MNFEGAWRFNSPGKIPAGVASEFSTLIVIIAAQQEKRQPILEHFKGYFARAVGATHAWSSSASWAETDLQTYMNKAAENAPLFIDAFYEACESLRKNYPDIHVPEVIQLNRILSKHEAGYEISPPNLIATNPQIAISVPEHTPSLSEQTQELIQESLASSEQLLAEGRNRQAVQEILWLLETVSTVFQGLELETGKVEGDYFNKIIADLRRHHKGKTLDQVLQWVTGLHGYLSSPKGGGIRHGTYLKAGISVTASEARLYCNLIQSYIWFLIAEHARIAEPDATI